MTRRFCVMIVAAALLTLGGCHRQVTKIPLVPPAQTAAQAGPVFEVSLWDGTVLSGPLAWLPDGAVRVSGRTIQKDDVRLIRQPSAAGAALAVDLSKLPEGFGPLSDDALIEYRKRAQDAADRYKGSDTVLCLDQGQDALLSDGTQLYRYHALFLILKDAGRSVANVSLAFRDGRSRARMLFARTITPDGASQWASADAFEVTVPPQAAQFVDTRSRVLSGQVPGAAVGVMVEYAYEHENYNPEIKEFFFPGYLFQSTKPVLDSVIDVLVPEGTALNYAALNMPESAAQPVRFAREGSDGYRWQMKHVPPLTPEPFMPAEEDVLPHMQGSLYFDWKDLMGPTGRFQRERIEATPEIKALADKLTAGKTTDDDKVAAIYHWVERNINYLSIKASLSSGWAGHPASETLKNGYGDCTDVSVLVTSLCRAALVDAYPAIIKTNDAGDMITQIPVPDANHAITLVYPNGRPRFIDATAEDYRYPYFRADDHDVKAIIHMKEEIMTTPLPPPEDNMRESRQEITLSPDGSATVVERNGYTGSYEAGVRGFWRSVPPEMRGMMMQQYLQGRSPGAALSDFKLGDMDDLDRQLTMEIDYKLPSLATRMQDLYIFTLPNFAQKFPEASLETRSFDVFLFTTQEYDTNVVVFLPDGYDFAGAPGPLAVHGKQLFFEGSIEKSDDGRALVVKQVFKRLTNRVSVGEYADYRRDAAAIAAWTDLKIVLKSAIFSPAGKEAGQ